MAIQFHDRERAGHPARVALFPGAWNPPTIAHVAIARAALAWADEVIWILPRSFPHKSIEGFAFEERLRMLRVLAGSESGFSVAVTDGGLYVEMADEAREFLGNGPEIGLLCGRDAAERIAAWDYGTPGVFDAMIARYPLLVAARAGEYLPAGHHAHRMIPLTMDPLFAEISSTEVRRRMASGEPWSDLVPAILNLHAEHRHAAH